MNSAPPQPARSSLSSEDGHERRSIWRRLSGFYGLIVVLHVAGWGLFLYYAASYPTLVGLGSAAYLFGLRHAFDADHIAAIDDTVRFLVQKGERPLGVGFFFSLGHSTVVFVIAMLLTVVAGVVKQNMPVLQQSGGLIASSVSGVFLWLVAILNIGLLLDIMRDWKTARRGGHRHPDIDALLQKRGFMNRLLGPRFRNAITRSWHMYPIGLLFGLGFGTASEVALLAMTAGAATGDLPLLAILALPLLFTAGMTVMDTTDAVLMTRAYAWAFINPVRKIFYNLFTTGISVGLAMLIGTVELAKVLVHVLGLEGPVAGFFDTLDFSTLGYYIVGVLILAWGLSAVLWHFNQNATARADS